MHIFNDILDNSQISLLTDYQDCINVCLSSPQCPPGQSMLSVHVMHLVNSPELCNTKYTEKGVSSDKPINIYPADPCGTPHLRKVNNNIQYDFFLFFQRNGVKFNELSVHVNCFSSFNVTYTYHEDKVYLIDNVGNQSI